MNISEGYNFTTSIMDYNISCCHHSLTGNHSSNNSGVHNVVDFLKESHLLCVLTFLTSFITEAFAAIYTRIKAKPLFNTGIPILTKVLHNVTCTGFYSLKTTINSFLMVAFVTVDPCLCTANAAGTAVGQLVCNWTNPINADALDQKLKSFMPKSKLPGSSTDLSIDMDIFAMEDTLRNSPLGEEKNPDTVDGKSPPQQTRESSPINRNGNQTPSEAVQQSFINSSGTVPFSKITLPDFPEAPPSPPTPSTLPGDSTTSPIRYQKPLYGSVDSTIPIVPGPRQTGPNEKMRTGSNPSIQNGPAPFLSKGPKLQQLTKAYTLQTYETAPKKAIKRNLNSLIDLNDAPPLKLVTNSPFRSMSTTDLQTSHIIPVRNNLIPTRTADDLRSGSWHSDPRSGSLSSTFKASSNPDLHRGLSSSTIRKGSNSNLRTGPLQSRWAGSNPDLLSASVSRSNLRAGPNTSLRSGPNSTLKVGNDPSLRTGPNFSARAGSISDPDFKTTPLPSIRSSPFLTKDTDQSGQQHTNSTASVNATTKSSDQSEPKELKRPKPIPRKRSSLSTKKQRPVPLRRTRSNPISPDDTVSANTGTSNVSSNNKIGESLAMKYNAEHIHSTNGEASIYNQPSASYWNRPSKTSYSSSSSSGNPRRVLPSVPD